MHNPLLTLLAVLSSQLLLAAPSPDSLVETTIHIHLKGCVIEGTLLASAQDHRKERLALILAGSGPTDRDGNNPLGVTASSYKLLAQELAKEHIATFRYDKRGIAKSKPEHLDETSLVFEDYIDDAAQVIRYLRDSLGFPDLYVIGHSEGSLIGMVASTEVPVRGFISISGAGRPIDEVIEEQLKKQPALIQRQVDSILLSLKKGQRVDSVPAYLMSLFRPSVQPYMISWLKYDPAQQIGKLRCPVLILQGSSDAQVTIQDAQRLHQAAESSKIDIIPLMTHTLKNAEENGQDPNFKTYRDASLPINRQLVQDIESFILD
jgi:uncharacterized protein